MKRRNTTGRRNKIVEMIQEREELRVSEAVKEFDVSDETIRKDFTYLEKRGILKKVHGGAIVNKSDDIEPISIRHTENYDIKLKIAKKAIEYIPKHNCIIGLDIGSTPLILSTLIGSLSDKIVITNSLPVLQQLSKSKNTVISTGGEYNPYDMCFRGELTKNALQNLVMDITFIASSGVLNRDGICSPNFYDIDIKREYLKRSRKKVVLIDSSKFNKSSLVEVANWSEVDLVISDDNIPEDDATTISQKTELIIV